MVKTFVLKISGKITNFDLKTRERIYARARRQPIPVKISIYENSSGDTIEFLNNLNDSFFFRLNASTSMNDSDKREKLMFVPQP